MSKNLFAVVLTDGQEAGAARLRNTYSEAELYSLGDNVFIVANDAISRTVGEVAGLTREQAPEGIRGVVLKLNGFYTGYTRQSLWDWLENVEAAE